MYRAVLWEAIKACDCPYLQVMFYVVTLSPSLLLFSIVLLYISDILRVPFPRRLSSAGQFGGDQVWRG